MLSALSITFMIVSALSSHSANFRPQFGLCIVHRLIDIFVQWLLWYLLVLVLFSTFLAQAMSNIHVWSTSPLPRSRPSGAAPQEGYRLTQGVRIRRVPGEQKIH